jgi:hypothetical protein
MFSYTSAISEKWLAIVFHGLKLDNTRNPFGHSFRHFRHPFRHIIRHPVFRSSVILPERSPI